MRGLLLYFSEMPFIADYSDDKYTYLYNAYNTIRVDEDINIYITYKMYNYSFYIYKNNDNIVLSYLENDKYIYSLFYTDRKLDTSNLDFIDILEIYANFYPLSDGYNFAKYEKEDIITYIQYIEHGDMLKYNINDTPTIKKQRVMSNMKRYILILMELKIILGTHQLLYIILIIFSKNITLMTYLYTGQ